MWAGPARCRVKACEQALLAGRVKACEQALYGKQKATVKGWLRVIGLQSGRQCPVLPGFAGQQPSQVLKGRPSLCPLT